jgi:hypothetical protein
MTYFVELSIPQFDYEIGDSKGLATCKGCKQKILPHTLRVTARAYNPKAKITFKAQVSYHHFKFDYS